MNGSKTCIGSWKFILVYMFLVVSFGLTIHFQEIQTFMGILFWKNVEMVNTKKRTYQAYKKEIVHLNTCKIQMNLI